MKKRVKRIYKAPDTHVLQYARDVIVFLTEDIDRMNDFDNSMNMSRVATMNTKIQEIDSHYSDEVILDKQMALTAIVKDRLDEAGEHYKEIRVFVRRLFRNSIPTQNRFGRDNFETARYSPVEMLQFLTELHLTIGMDSHRARLINSGADAVLMDATPARHTALKKALSERNVDSKKRTALTDERITRLNALWVNTQEIKEVAEVVFKNEPGHYQRYVFSYTPSSSGPRSFLITANQRTIVSLSTELQPNSVLDLINLGESSLYFFIAPTTQVTTVPAQASLVPPGQTVRVIASSITLPAGGNSLIVMNMNTIDGRYRVAVI